MSTGNPVSRKQPKVDLDITRERLTKLGLLHASDHVSQVLGVAPTLSIVSATESGGSDSLGVCRRDSDQVSETAASSTSTVLG
jgi:hypothetical protein